MTGVDVDASGPGGARARLPEVLQALHEQCRHLDGGRVADYIPELAAADPGQFGIAVALTDGALFEQGDATTQFTIQSVSKPFVYGLALQDHGRDRVLSKIGVEPSGEAFNAIILDHASKRPFNPMINAGAIATTDLIKGRDYAERARRMDATLARFAGRPLRMDEAVFASERATGHRNRAIAHLMRSFDMLSDRIEETLDLYFRQCSVLVSCRDLAFMGATLANRGIHPRSGERAIEQQYVKDLLSIMLSCGMYDYSGEWAYRIGLPAKSGVGGGIVAVIPGQGAVATYAPRLDDKGNSVRGIRVLEALAEEFGLHFLESVFRGNTLR